MPNSEYVRWQTFYGRRAQAAQLAAGQRRQPRRRARHAGRR